MAAELAAKGAAMHYLVYVSQAVKPMSVADLDAILAQSRANNPALGVTGLLLYRYSPDTDSGHFIQCLEGEEAAVRTLYETIARDRRHHTKLVLDRGEAAARMFGDWAMGFKNIDDRALAAAPGFARIGEASFAPERFQQPHGKALELLKIFFDAP